MLLKSGVIPYHRPQLLFDLRRNPVIRVGQKLAHVADKCRHPQRFPGQSALSATFDTVERTLEMIVNIHFHLPFLQSLCHGYPSSVSPDILNFHSPNFEQWDGSLPASLCGLGLRVA